jgi:hypothetical protein
MDIVTINCKDDEYYIIGVGDGGNSMPLLMAKWPVIRDIMSVTKEPLACYIKAGPFNIFCDAVEKLWELNCS